MLTRLRVRVGFVVGAGEPHRQDGGRLGLEAEVREHVLHQRLVDQRLSERAAMSRVVRRVNHCDPHSRGGSEHTVKTGVSDHLDDGAHTLAGLADHLRPCTGELDLRGGVGLVAELVLQALDVHLVS